MYKIIFPRIKKELPSNLKNFVVPKSTPILFFGNIENSIVATLGINPSKYEFVDKNGKLLKGVEQRVETMDSLKAQTLSNLNKDKVKKVYNACIDYFNKNPYKQWFDVLENYILKPLNVSYYAGTACHLDCVQSATVLPWSKLPKTIADELIINDIHFLSTLLCYYRIKLLLINGRTVMKILRNYFEIIPLKNWLLKNKNETCEINQYELKINCCKKIKIIGWSKNIQSSFGLTNKMREQVSKCICEIYGKFI